MNIKRVSSLKLLIAASILVGFGSYVFAPPVIAKPTSPPIGSPPVSQLPKCTNSAQQNSCRP